MSRRSSSSGDVEIQPPDSATFDSSSDTHHNRAQDHRTGSAPQEGGIIDNTTATGSEIEEVPVSSKDTLPLGPRRVSSSNMAGSPLASKACERCVSKKLECRGPPGVRCETCKKVKQRCTNSTGPAKGKPSLKKVASNNLHAASKPLANDKPGKHKRKREPSEDKSASLVGDGSTIDTDEQYHDEGNGVDSKGPATKKRRLSASNTAKYRKAISDMKDVRNRFYEYYNLLGADLKKLDDILKEFDFELEDN